MPSNQEKLIQNPDISAILFVVI